MIQSTQGRYVVWDRASDPYDYTVLADNFVEMDTVLGGDGSPGLTVTRKGDLTGVRSSWLGSGDGTKIGYRLASGDANTIPRNLYNVVSGLVENDVPLGTVVAWFRPSSSIAVPDGWAICDGSVVTPSQHSWEVGSTIQLPDLRNKFVLGADTLKPDGTASTSDMDNVSYTPENVSNSTDTGAPGIGYDSVQDTVLGTRVASNTRRDIGHDHPPGTYQTPVHSHGMANHTHLVTSHTHTVQPHTHVMTHRHKLPQHYHYVADSRTAEDDLKVHHYVYVNEGSQTRVARDVHYHLTFDEDGTDLNRALSQGFIGSAADINSIYVDPTVFPFYSQMHDGFKPMFSSLPINVHPPIGGNPPYDSVSDTQPSAILTTDPVSGTPTGPPSPLTSETTPAASITGASGTPTFFSSKIVTSKVDVRPAHVGLLYIIKVKKVFNLIGKTSADSHNRL